MNLLKLLNFKKFRNKISSKVQHSFFGLYTIFRNLIDLFNFFQLKHISRHVMDILITMAKTLDLTSVQYLLELNGKLPVLSHTKQTLLLSSLLIRNIWSASLNGFTPEKKVQHPVPIKKPCKFLRQSTTALWRLQFYNVLIQEFHNFLSFCIYFIIYYRLHWIMWLKLHGVYCFNIKWIF